MAIPKEDIFFLHYTSDPNYADGLELVIVNRSVTCYSAGSAVRAYYMSVPFHPNNQENITVNNQCLSLLRDGFFFRKFKTVRICQTWSAPRFSNYYYPSCRSFLTIL